LGTSNDLIKAAADSLQLPMMSRLFLIIVESNLSHCLWEQVMNLSKLLITPSIADNVKALF
jgi:hypothetical protein